MCTLALAASMAACGSPKGEPAYASGGDGGAGNPGGTGGSGASLLPPNLGSGDAGPAGGEDDGSAQQPSSCAAAANEHSNVGCEFWPTIVFNPVWSVFDFAAVVANASTQLAQITVDQNGTSVATATIPPGGIAPIKLPWVKALKGPDFDDGTNGARPTTSALVQGGAYHLTSSVPVTVWQYNPLEYEVPVSECPYPPSLANGDGINCLSVTNGATILIPTAAMTGNYRVFAAPANTSNEADAASDPDAPDAIAITATADGTMVTVSLVAGASVIAGTGVTATAGPGNMTFTLDAGDVVELVAARGNTWGASDSDPSGSLVTANQPVQVISFDAITDVPAPAVYGQGYADNLQETILPAESLGSHYVVAPPTTPTGSTVGHYLRFFGYRDGTTLTYPSGSPPAGAPTTLNAGDVVQISGAVTTPFEVQGSNEFAIASIMMGGQAQDPGNDDPQGDPGMTFEVAVEQFRSQYIFLAPTDYAESYADILVPPGASVTLDGAALTATPTSIDSGWSIVRELLSTTGTGAHTLVSDQPVGLKIMGFGHATAYYTIGGLNVNHIAPLPPPPPK